LKDDQDMSRDQWGTIWESDQSSRIMQARFHTLQIWTIIQLHQVQGGRFCTERRV